MTDFANFLFINEISKKDIAEFLGVSNSFITKICKGEKNLPEEQRSKIMKNPFGWNVNVLSPGTTNITAKASSGSSANVNIGNRSTDAESLAVLRKEIEMLRDQLNDKNEQIEFLKSLLTK